MNSRPMPALCSIAVLSVLLTISSIAVLAQTPSSGLRGQVTDPSGAVVTGVTVTATGSDGKAATSVTNSKGTYEIKGLPPGQYTVTAVAKGFAQYKADFVTVAAGQVQTLDIALEIDVQKQQVEVQDQSTNVDVSAANNASTTVIKGKDLEALSDDPDELQSELEALAGPAAGPNGGQIYIDGFSNGTLPPKSSIREIRINQNPFTAQYDRFGMARIEVFTKPGTDKFHGQFGTNINNAVLNSKNPYGPADRPGYSTQQYNGNFGGPLSKKASFFFNTERRSINDVALVDATVLDSNFNPVLESLAVLHPQTRTSISPRFDFQLTPRNTLTARYQFNRNSRTNDGISAFSLPSQAYNSNSTEHEVQISDTQTLSARIVNETRFQYERNNSDQKAQILALIPTISVPQAFRDGGNSLGISTNDQDRYELQNYTAMQVGTHFIKFGGRLRTVQLSSESTSNYNGTFTFASINAYQITQKGLSQGLTPAQIRAAGGGAIQFTLTAGQPLASVSQADVGVYAEDEWRIRPKITLSYGLRVESQGNINDHFDVAPRFGFIWGLGRGKNTPKTVLRTGYGMFYDRFGESQVLQAVRLNGTLQQQFVVPLPDFYPTVPAASTLSNFQASNTIYQISPRLRAPYTQQAAIGLERQVTKTATMSVTYINSRGVHQLYLANINAPLGNNPNGTRPLGNVGNIYQYNSEGIFKQQQLLTTANLRIGAKLSLSSFYNLNFANGNTSGPNSFPVDQFSLAQEYGRTAYDVRHRFTVFATLSLPHGVRFSPFIIANSGTPFNITVGRDLNGDSIINDRPGIATDPTRAGVVQTRYGLLDPNPIAGEKIVPLNFGTTPSLFTFNVRLGKTFGFGKPLGETSGPANRGDRGGFGGGDRGPGGGGERGGGPGGPGPMRGLGGGGDRGGFGGGGTGTGRRYNLTVSAFALNLFNDVNLGAPISNLSSGNRFGTFYQLAGGVFGPGGGAGGASPSNRRISLQMQFSF